MKTKCVFDADVPVVIDRFNEKDTEEKLAYYKSLGKWGDVSVDQGGDIILWEEE